MKLNHNILSLYGKPWAVQAAGQPFVYFEYNLAGDNTKVYSSVANDWERNYTYDLLGRRLTYTEGELVESLTYNGGNLAAHSQSWTENNQMQTKTTTYHYNAHRLDSVCYDDALTTIYHYDQYGRVDSLYDESGVMCYEYGNMGEVTNETRIYALPFLSQPIALATQFTYDSWGRIQSITYPDNEVVSYAYDLGGQLQSITNNSSYTYLDNVTYDRFGAKVSQTYGNGITTDYSYNNVTRRLSTITTLNGNSQISTFAYTYDNVGNVTQVTSSCPWLQNQTFTESFTYDASDQLTAATESQSQSYQLAVTYGNWGKINSYSLAQTDMQSNITQSEAQAYTYPATNSIGNSQTLFAPQQRTITDANNNVSTETLTFGINGSLRKREVQGVVPHTEHYLFNSQANLIAYSNNLTDFAYYGYNASNTRAYKLGLSGSSQWVNGQQQSLHLGPQQAMFYPNAYINFNQNGEYTKHYYNGSERIASRLGNTALSISMEMTDRLQERVGKLETRFQDDIRELVYTNVQVETPPVSATSLQQTGTPDDIFYYHTNHLGSTAFVTDQNRNITQGFLYAPFGEITTEFNATFGNDIIPKYSFNAKELDEETGMYYYEARYYKPPVFTSRDPMMNQKPWLTPYHYCSNNPVGRVDPSGMMDGDYFDLDGNYLGNDGVYDGKVYVITNKNEVNRIKAMQNDNCDAIISDVYSAIDLAVSSDMRKKMINDIITNEEKNNLCEYGGIVRSGEEKIDDEIIDEIFIDWGKGETWKGAGHNAEFDYNTCINHGTPLLFFHSHFPGKDKNGIGIEQEPSSFDLKNVSEHEARRNRANIVISTENNMVYLINNNKKYYEMNINVYINITNIYTPSRK